MTRRIAPFLVVLAAVLLSACAHAAYTNRSQFILISRGEEMQLGLKAARQVLRTEKESRDALMTARVRRIGRRIAAAADRPDYKWEFHLIDKKEVNAFCLPGGKVFIYSGILRFTTSNDELAAVMGHEIAHALERHGAERMSMALLAQMGGEAASVAVGASVGGPAMQVFDQVYGIGAQVGVLLPHSREQESEADEVGMILAAKAGYDPRGALSLWRKMAEYSRRMGKGRAAWFSDHPSDAQRIRDIEAKLPRIRARYYHPRYFAY